MSSSSSLYCLLVAVAVVVVVHSLQSNVIVDIYSRVRTEIVIKVFQNKWKKKFMIMDIRIILYLPIMSFIFVMQHAM